MKSTPSGLDPMQVYARYQNLRVTGGYVKSFQIGMICADPRIYSQTEHSLSSSAGAGSVIGVAWPIVWPAVWGGGSGADATVAVNNVGNIDTPPRFRVTGPITNPEIRNETSGESIYIDNLDLAVGEYVDVDVAMRTAVTDSDVNVYHLVRFPDTAWFMLQPGINDLELRATDSDSGVGMTVYWRDAWV